MILLALLETFVALVTANSLCNPLVMQPVTIRLLLSLRIRTIVLPNPPGSLVPTLEPTTNTSSLPLQVVTNIPSHLTPLHTPHLSREFPIWHTASNVIEVLTLIFRYVLMHSGNDYLGQEYW